MMNKKGVLVLRDMMFMMLIVSSIFVFAGLFVSDMATKYENTNMSEEWAITGTNTLANTTFIGTSNSINDTGAGLSEQSTGIWALLSDPLNTLKGIGDMLFMVVLAPNTIGNLLSSTLGDMGVDPAVTQIIKFLLVGVLWSIVIFTIGAAFLRGGRL